MDDNSRSSVLNMDYTKQEKELPEEVFSTILKDLTNVITEAILKAQNIDGVTEEQRQAMMEEEVLKNLGNYEKMEE